MSKKLAFGVALAAMFAATSAEAGYTIYEESAYPSVLFVDIEGSDNAPLIKNTSVPTVIGANAAGEAVPTTPAPTTPPTEEQQASTAQDSMNQAEQEFRENPNQAISNAVTNELILQNTGLR